MKYIGCCMNKKCERNGKEVRFPIRRLELVESYRNEPEVCTMCGEPLQGDVCDV